MTDRQYRMTSEAEEILAKLKTKPNGEIVVPEWDDF